MTAMRISTDRAELDVAMIHRFLSSESYWARGMPLSVVEAALAGSLCFGGYLDSTQIALARMISDYATFGYLADVFVLPPWRGQGYGTELLAAVFAHPRLQGLRRSMLVTSDAQSLYVRFGFTALASPERVMERCSAAPYSVPRS